jgi:hypothetical protein
MSLVLDVAIGITFLYLLLALIVTTVQELIAAWLGLRAKNLYDAIAGMLQAPAAAKDRAVATAPKLPNDRSPTLLEELYLHPLVKNLRDAKFLSPDKLRLPSYVPSKTFAIALLDVLRGRSTLSRELGAPKLLAGARETVSRMQGHDDLKRALELVFEEAEAKATRVDEEIALVTAGIETWFNDRMSRASGWYKRKAQLIGLGLAFAVTSVSNADSIHVVSELWKNGALRDTVAAAAQAYYDHEQGRAKAVASASVTEPPGPGSAAATASASAPAPAASTAAGTVAPEPATSAAGSASNAAGDVQTAAKNVAAAIDEVGISSLPIGWHESDPQDFDAWFWRVVGWLITTLAVSLGAGFWFDALGNALGLRKTGPRVSAATGRTEDQD